MKHSSEKELENTDHYSEKPTVVSHFLSQRSGVQINPDKV